MLEYLHNFLGFISNTKILGLIPLDIFAHLLVSYSIFIYLLYKRKFPILLSYIVVFTLSIFKEIFDSFSLTNTVEENVKDILVSMIFPTAIILVRYIKRRTT